MTGSRRPRAEAAQRRDGCSFRRMNRKERLSMDFYMARNEDIKPVFSQEGYACTELLPGSFDDTVRNYKCFLKAGSKIAPQLYADKVVLLFFGKGEGHVTDPKGGHSIRELCFYAPAFDKAPYEVQAYTDMEFVMAVIEMSEGDWEDYAASRVRLPFFRTLSQCFKYDQDCKGPNTTSWFVLNAKQLGHIMVGVVRAVGEGTVEKGHPAVHQWNYCVGDSDFDMTVNGVTVPHRAGEWSFIPAGPDHSLVAKPGKEVFYVWFEKFTRKGRDFILKPMPKKAYPLPGPAKFYVARDEDMKRVFNENGFAMTELLPGTYAGGISNYKCWLKAGQSVSPDLKKDETVLVMFGKGEGYVRSSKNLFNVTEPAFYVPNFDKEPYTIHAVEDMEFVLSVVKRNESDKALYDACHVRLPFFTLYSNGVAYDQNCKGPNTTSWHILGPKQLGRIMVGVVRAVGEGTTEKGHPRVEQWNYCLGHSDFLLKVDDEPAVAHKAGDFSYVPAGYDHALVAEPGKEVFYVWYEHYTREKDFCVALAEGDDASLYE